MYEPWAAVRRGRDVAGSGACHTVRMGGAVGTVRTGGTAGAAAEIAEWWRTSVSALRQRAPDLVIGTPGRLVDLNLVYAERLSA